MTENEQLTDLVEQLREWQYYDPKAFGREILKNVAEAADEVERLRAALQRAEGRVGKWHNKVCKQEAEIERLRMMIEKTTGFTADELTTFQDAVIARRRSLS